MIGLILDLIDAKKLQFLYTNLNLSRPLLVDALADWIKKEFALGLIQMEECQIQMLSNGIYWQMELLQIILSWSA